MTERPNRPATAEGLFVWVLHRFAEVFEHRAIVKGGIALRLLDCPRSTTDIDYVFVPFDSKKDLVPRIDAVLGELGDATIDVRLHSKMLRAKIELDGARIQIEANVDTACPSTAVPTGALATAQGRPSRIVRVVEAGRALADKLAAWNERRLLRDLYDVYYLGTRLGARVDREALQSRLAAVESRRPELRGRDAVTLDELRVEIMAALDTLDGKRIGEELGPVLPADELEALLPRLRAGVVRVLEQLDSGG